jgi:hypothetical protein
MVATGGPWGFKGNYQREGLADFLTQIGYKNRPFTEISGDTEAKGFDHEWNERSLRSRDFNRETQGFNYSFADVSIPTRRRNYTQIIEDSVFVDRTAARSMYAGVSDVLADQIQNRMTEHMMDIEFGLLRGTLITSLSGSSGAQMNGLLSVLANMSSNGLIGSGGSASVFTTASLAVTHINDCQDLLESRGLTPTDVLCNPTIKKRISAATTSNTKYILASDKEQIENVMVYEGDFGRSQLRVTRDFPVGLFTTVTTNTANLLNSTVVIDRSMYAKAWLDRTFMERVPKREDGVGVEIITELTLEYAALTGGHYIQTL